MSRCRRNSVRRSSPSAPDSRAAFSASMPTPEFLEGPACGSTTFLLPLPEGGSPSSFRGGVRIAAGVRRQSFQRHTALRIGRRLAQTFRRDSQLSPRSQRNASATAVRPRPVMRCMVAHATWVMAVAHFSAERPRPSVVRRDAHTAHTAQPPRRTRARGISTYLRSCRSRYCDSCPGRRTTLSVPVASRSRIRFRAARSVRCSAAAIADIGPVQGREPPNSLNSRAYVRSCFGLLTSDAGT